MEWLAERLRDFLDANPEFETPIERFATWLARLDRTTRTSDRTPTETESRSPD